MAVHIHGAVSTACFVALLILGLLILGVAGLKGRALADVACLERPTRDAPAGEHWYFHQDREKNRKCWHLGTSAAPVVHEAPPLVPRAERTHTFLSSVNAAFASLARKMRSLFRRPMPHEVVAGEPRIIQNDATKPLTMEDIAQFQQELPEERAESRPGSPGSATVLTAAQRKALYEEFLKWLELHQRVGGASPAQP
jgi:hypothetical protein